MTIVVILIQVIPSVVVIQTEAAQADNLVVKYRGHKCDYRSTEHGRKR